MKQLYFTCVTIIILSVSCTSAKETMVQTTPLYDTRWSLKKIYSDGKEEIITTKAFIRFNKEKGSAGGNGSCNSFGSTAVIDSSRITFKDIFSTKMYCEKVQQVENKYLRKLAKASRYEIKENKLLIYTDKELLLEFTAEEEKKGTE